MWEGLRIVRSRTTAVRRATQRSDVLMQAGEPYVLVPLSTSPSSLRSANRYGANTRNNGDQCCSPQPSALVVARCRLPLCEDPQCRGCARPDDARSSMRKCGLQQSAYGDTMTAEY